MKSNAARSSCRNERGLTLLELIMTIAILMILSTAAIPLFERTVVRDRETELRSDLREMRSAIDRYKDLADKNLIRSTVGSEGYPADLDTLVKGVDFGSAGERIRFLRRIPVDPITRQKDWALQSIQQESDSREWDGANVFDVHSKSQATGLDGSEYSTW